MNEARNMVERRHRVRDDQEHRRDSQWCPVSIPQRGKRPPLNAHGQEIEPNRNQGAHAFPALGQRRPRRPVGRSCLRAGSECTNADTEREDAKDREASHRCVWSANGRRHRADSPAAHPPTKADAKRALEAQQALVASGTDESPRRLARDAGSSNRHAIAAPTRYREPSRHGRSGLYFVPKRRSPASPMPGTMKPPSSRRSSTAAV